MNITIHFKRIITVSMGMVFLGLSACSSNNKKEALLSAEKPIIVTVSSPSSDEQKEINISGQVESAQSANISTRVMGYITKLLVKVGDRVSEGQLLATISNQDILAKRAQIDAMIAEAMDHLKNAQKDYERFTVLYKQQSASEKELDNITLQYNAAQSRVEAAKQMRNEVNAMLIYTSLTAPFSGIVTQKLMDAGSMASPGMPILTIEHSGSYQLTAAVPENSIQQIQQGGEAFVTIKASNKNFKGTITQINQSSAFTGGQYMIKISIPDNQKTGLYAGMYATISVPVKAITSAVPSDQVLVPIACIENKDQLTGLFTIGTNGTALLRWVRLGKVYGNKVEVLSGLEKTEQFIVSAEGKLYNGAPITIK